MKARAVVAVDHHHDGSRYQTLRSDPPLLLRPTGDALQLVGGAAGPLGGDQLGYDIHVGSAASLVVRSVAASMALPDAPPPPSRSPPPSARVHRSTGLRSR